MLAIQSCFQVLYLLNIVRILSRCHCAFLTSGESRGRVLSRTPTSTLSSPWYVKFILSHTAVAEGCHRAASRPHIHVSPVLVNGLSHATDLRLPTFSGTLLSVCPETLSGLSQRLTIFHRPSTLAPLCGKSSTPEHPWYAPPSPPHFPAVPDVPTF